MAEDLKQTIESYVTTALKSRIDDGTRAVDEFREELAAAAARLAEKLKASGGEPLSLPDELFPPPPPPPPPPEAHEADEAGTLQHILTCQHELLAAGDQVGLLTQLLLASTVSCPRVAFFIVKRDTFAGWAARGFSGAQDSDVRSLSIGAAEDTILGAAFRSGVPVRGPGDEHRQNAQFLSRLGATPPAEAMAVPIWIRDKIAAILYGDCGNEESITNPEIPEILANHAGLCLETLASRQKSPRPRAGDAVVSTSGPQPSIPVKPAPAPAPAPASTVASQASTAAPPQAASLGGILSQPSFTPPPAPAQAVAPVAAPHAAPPPAPAASRPGLSTSGPYPALDGLPEDERKAHEEARRFARLLVSEIILYNERQVEEGRRNKDIYERLKEDIDRSLAMYEQRISAKVRAGSNYFHQELVRTLANGDESAIKVPWA